MSKLQLNFNGGEIGPDEWERVDLDLYQSALARAENVICRPQGGISSRGGLRKFSRLRRQLAGRTLQASELTLPNGGVAADMAAGTATETTAAMAQDADYIVAEIDFGTPVTVAALDLEDFYLNDGTPGAGSSGGSTTPGGGSQPDVNLPPDFDWSNGFYIP